MQRSHYRGHPIIWQDARWVYEDTGEPVPTTWKERPCGYCDLPQTYEGHDGCLGTLPGIMNACCGHGVEREAYVQFIDGATIHGESAVTILGELKKNRVSGGNVSMGSLRVSDLQVGQKLDMQCEQDESGGWFYWGDIEQDDVERLKRELSCGTNLWRISQLQNIKFYVSDETGDEAPMAGVTLGEIFNLLPDQELMRLISNIEVGSTIYWGMQGFTRTA